MRLITVISTWLSLSTVGAPAFSSPTDVTSTPQAATPAAPDTNTASPHDEAPQTSTELAHARQATTLFSQTPLGGGPPRTFVATTIDLGYKFFRPRLSAGYGRPFDTWAGVDLNPQASNTFVGGYGGVRLATPFANLRSGLLYTLGFARSLLPIRDSYTRAQAERNLDEQNVHYAASSTELTLTIPIVGVFILSESEFIHLLGVRTDRYLFLETIGVVTDPSWVFRQRLGLGLPVTSVEGLAVGAVGELVAIPGRDANVWRAGILARWRLFDDVGLRLSMLPVIASPDYLGLTGGEFEFGLRWSWSS